MPNRRLQRMARLIYRSVVTEGVGWRDIAKIINSACTKNDDLNVTGVLVLSEGCFLQVLEGPVAAVNHLYTRIVQDERHNDVELISYQQVMDRRYPNWAMHGLNMDDLGEEVSDLLKRKYGKNKNGVRIPDEPVLAESLLLDVAGLGEARKGL